MAKKIRRNKKKVSNPKRMSKLTGDKKAAKNTVKKMAKTAVTF